MRRFAWLVIAGLLGILVAAAAGQGPGQKPQYQNQHRNRCSLMQELRRLPLEHVGNREARDLLYLLEQEKLARDVYLTSFERWQLPIFRRIAGSERSHLSWARALVRRYELQDPTEGNGLGVFSDPGLTDLYQSLTVMSDDTEEGALLVAAAIEEMDIHDLGNGLERSNNLDLDTLYQNLLKGSRNHLRVFSRALADRGVAFEPNYLSPEEYQELLETPLEGGVVDAEGERICGGGAPR